MLVPRDLEREGMLELSIFLCSVVLDSCATSELGGCVSLVRPRVASECL